MVLKFWQFSVIVIILLLVVFATPFLGFLLSPPLQMGVSGSSLVLLLFVFGTFLRNPTGLPVPLRLTAMGQFAAENGLTYEAGSRWVGNKLELFPALSEKMDVTSGRYKGTDFEAWNQPVVYHSLVDGRMPFGNGEPASLCLRISGIKSSLPPLEVVKRQSLIPDALHFRGRPPTFDEDYLVSGDDPKSAGARLSAAKGALGTLCKRLGFHNLAYGNGVLTGSHKAKFYLSEIKLAADAFVGIAGALEKS